MQTLAFASDPGGLQVLCGMSMAAWLGFTYLMSELLLTLTRRSRGRGVKQDHSTLRVIWLVIAASVAAGIYLATQWHRAAMPRNNLLTFVAIALFVLGLALRWWAIVVLGRFFTIDVQIAPDHELVDSGPFRFVRHPSYTGVLLAFIGFALSLGNWAAIVVIVVPIFVAFVRRMNVEEQALARALDQRYRVYMQRTKRLLPGLY